MLTGSGCDSGGTPEAAPQKTYRIGIDIPFHPLFNYVSVNTDELGTLTLRLGRLSDARMDELCRALATAVGCDG